MYLYYSNNKGLNIEFTFRFNFVKYIRIYNHSLITFLAVITINNNLRNVIQHIPINILFKKLFLLNSSKQWDETLVFVLIDAFMDHYINEKQKLKLKNVTFPHISM